MTLTGHRLSLALIILLVAADTARSGIFQAAPRPLGRHDVYSKNEMYVLDVNPEASRSTIYAVSDRTRPLWSFAGILKTDIRRILLADDGSVVAMIGGGDGSQTDSSRVEAVKFVDRAGATRTHFLREYAREPTIANLCGGSMVNWYEEVIDRGSGFVIRTTDGKEHSFRYTTSYPARRLLTAGGITAGVGIAVLLIVWPNRRRHTPAPPVEPVS